MHREIGSRPDGRLSSLAADFENLKGAGQGIDEVVREFGLVRKVGIGSCPMTSDVANPIRCGARHCQFELTLGRCGLGG